MAEETVGGGRRAYGYVRSDFVKGPRADLEAAESEREVLRYFNLRMAPKGFVWAGLFRDPFISAKLGMFDRPAGSKLLARLRERDAVIVPKVECGPSSAPDLLTVNRMLAAKGARLVLLDLRLSFPSKEGSEFLRAYSTASLAWTRTEPASLQRDLDAGMGIGTRFWMNKRAPWGYSKKPASTNSVTGQRYYKLVVTENKIAVAELAKDLLDRLGGDHGRVAEELTARGIKNIIFSRAAWTGSYVKAVLRRLAKFNLHRQGFKRFLPDEPAEEVANAVPEV